jgi:hypothetical protein
VAKRLLPTEIAARILQSSRTRCIELLGDGLLLLVRVDDRSPNLLQGLIDSSAGETDELLPSVEDEGTGTITAAIDLDEMLRQEAASSASGKLKILLERETYFVAPLRRRRMPDRPIQQQISVGRGEYNDLVLRDASVSNVHGWLERDENGSYYLSDARSRNTTRVNEIQLHGGGPTRLAEGDEIWFGSVKVLLSHPCALWDALHDA